MFLYGNLMRQSLGMPEDPRQARAARRRMWVMSVPTALAWALAGWSGALGILDQFRLMSLNRISSWHAGGSSVSLTLIFTAAVMFASLCGVATTFAGRAARWSGRGFGVGRFAVTLGLAIGTAVAIPAWTVPESVGSRLPFMDGDPVEPWSSADWVIYYAPYLLPAVFGLFAVVTGGLLLRAAWMAARHEDAVGAVRHQGRRVTGRIDNVEFTRLWVMGNPQFRVQVTFPGSMGPRTVVTTMTTSQFAPPVAGGSVDVLFDPNDEESAIVEAPPAYM